MTYCQKRFPSTFFLLKGTTCFLLTHLCAHCWTNVAKEASECSLIYQESFRNWSFKHLNTALRVSYMLELLHCNKTLMSVLISSGYWKVGGLISGPLLSMYRSALEQNIEPQIASDATPSVCECMCVNGYCWRAGVQRSPCHRCMNEWLNADMSCEAPRLTRKVLYKCTAFTVNACMIGFLSIKPRSLLDNWQEHEL